MKKTIIYLTGAQGSGKTELSKSIINSLEVGIEQLPSLDEYEKFFTDLFETENFNYIIVTDQENGLLRGIRLNALAAMLKVSFIKITILL